MNKYAYAADKCPQGRMGGQTRCSIWLENKQK